MFEIDKKKCAGCGACVQHCPVGAVKIGKDGKAFINQSKCQRCGRCRNVCPFDAIKEIKESEFQKKVKEDKNK
jgi:ferredoxin